MADDPRDLRLYEAVLAALRAADGTGHYHNDLSELVFEGEYVPTNPPRSPPCVAVSDPVSEMGEGPALPGYSCRVTIRGQLWVRGEDAAGGSARPRLRLAADIRRALRAARETGASSLLYAAHDLTVVTTTADGRQLGIAGGRGYGEFEISVSYLIGDAEAE